GMRAFPGSDSAPVSPLFQDLNGDGVPDIAVGMPPGEESGDSTRLFAIAGPYGKKLWDATVGAKRTPWLWRDPSGPPDAPLLVTLHGAPAESAPSGAEPRDSANGALLETLDGAPPSAPLVAAELRDPATGLLLEKWSDVDRLRLSELDVTLLAALPSGDASGRPDLLVLAGTSVTRLSLDRSSPGMLWAYDASWLAA